MGDDGQGVGKGRPASLPARRQCREGPSKEHEYEGSGQLIARFRFLPFSVLVIY